MGTASCKSCLAPFIWLPGGEGVLEVPSPRHLLRHCWKGDAFPSAVSGEGEDPILPMLGVRVTHRSGFSSALSDNPKIKKPWVLLHTVREEPLQGEQWVTGTTFRISGTERVETVADAVG